ncbi:putative solute carrier organic anion transporter family member 1A4 [Apostichopus japonicus]|uniref:Putative solute carrier organic anion transporter family member 1A4 n=1 Tax=Stichopus japonicus TaxID=307972 RepID=A0A2G8JI42_STIJA|nr:putative solute carrier organic anion transporter family member 1A4 [Apostichopus japonicus]
MASFNPRESPVVFLAVWSLSTVFYKSIGGYWSSVITTVEKIFHLSTSQSGFLTAFDYFAGLWVMMPLVYIGQFCHRPRFMAVITILTSLGTLVQTFPHFLYQTSLEEFLNGKGSDDLSSGLCGGLNDSLVDSTEPECKRGDVLSLLTGPVVWLVIGRIMTCSYGAIFPIALVYLDDGVAKKSIVLYAGICPRPALS